MSKSAHNTCKTAEDVYYWKKKYTQGEGEKKKKKEIGISKAGSRKHNKFVTSTRQKLSLKEISMLSFTI